MDFNTGSGGGTAGSGGSSRGPGGAPARAFAAPGGEFDYRDPVQSFINAVRSVVTAPVGFFRGIAHQGDFINPLLFAVICTLISAILGGIVGFFFSVALANEGVIGAFAGFIWSVIRSLIVVALGLFIGAGIWHLLVMLFVKPTNAGYGATFRVAAYSAVVYLVS